MDAIEFYTISVLCLIVGGAIGLMIAKLITFIIRSIVRASHKSKIKYVMAREAYINDLYEECLYEHQDKLARKAAKEMSYYDR